MFSFKPRPVLILFKQYRCPNTSRKHLFFSICIQLKLRLRKIPNQLFKACFGVLHMKLLVCLIHLHLFTCSVTITPGWSRPLNQMIAIIAFHSDFKSSSVPLLLPSISKIIWRNYYSWGLNLERATVIQGERYSTEISVCHPKKSWVDTGAF